MKSDNVRIGVVFFRHLEIGHHRISDLGTTLAGLIQGSPGAGRTCG